jgi:hypothetical protein
MTRRFVPSFPGVGLAKGGALGAAKHDVGAGVGIGAALGPAISFGVARARERAAGPGGEPRVWRPTPARRRYHAPMRLLWAHAVSCAHLAALEAFLRGEGIPVQSEGGSWWSRQSGGWIAFECYLSPSLRDRFRLPEFVAYEASDGKAAGQEAGFRCARCESGVMGVHPAYAAGLRRVS